MALIGREPLADLGTIQDEMNRLFDTFSDGGGVGNSPAEGRRWVPAMDLVETDDEFVVRADLPGLSENEVSIELEGSVLTISGERKIEQEGAGRATTASGAPPARSSARSRCPRASRLTASPRGSIAACWRCGSPSPSGAGLAG